MLEASLVCAEAIAFATVGVVRGETFCAGSVAINELTGFMFMPPVEAIRRPGEGFKKVSVYRLARASHFRLFVEIKTAARESNGAKQPCRKAPPSGFDARAANRTPR